MTSRAIPAVYMRGGTSKALIFHRRDLPPATADDEFAAWRDIFLAAIGSPDANGRQLNGMGGGISSLSKIAVVEPSSTTDADVDYTFGQVGVLTPSVSYRGNCGNISSAIGPFAVDEGLFQAGDGSATVRIHNTNTRKIIHATFPVQGGRSALDGDFYVQGVAGTGAAIKLDFLDPAGAATGSLLPSGVARETLAIADDISVEVSLVDAANPVCFARASDFGLTGRESPAAIGGDAHLMELLVSLRVSAALKMGLVDSPERARTQVTNLPLVCLVARPDPSRHENEQGKDLVIRMLSMDQPHKATPLTGALCAAAAAGIKDSLVREHLASGFDPQMLKLAHPSGDLAVAVDGDKDGIAAVTVYRTARRLMKGFVEC